MLGNDNLERWKKIIYFIFVLLFLVMITLILYMFNVIPHRQFTNEDFGIETYKSLIDKDGDGIDDQTDFLQSVRNYIATKPKYKSKYYRTGYPDDGFGVCTDVIAFGLRGAGYDLMELVDADIRANKKMYQLDVVDKNIDFRRVNNLRIFFEHNAKSLTTDLTDIKEWQGGDIIVFKTHIGVVSDKRNWRGIPFIIHNGGFHFEEDILEYRTDIVGHFRMS
ncbi:MAG: DUF1287 domain-containing protein [Candidatus Nanosynbacter sp.]|nr:DUF1287 domain-containing protein [Candidatus Nanosynbacter sp.]